jgi:hypothetical protein
LIVERFLTTSVLWKQVRSSGNKRSYMLKQNQAFETKHASALFLISLVVLGIGSAYSLWFVTVMRSEIPSPYPKGVLVFQTFSVFVAPYLALGIMAARVRRSTPASAIVLPGSVVAALPWFLELAYFSGNASPDGIVRRGLALLWRGFSFVRPNQWTLFIVIDLVASFAMRRHKTKVEATPAG